MVEISKKIKKIIVAILGLFVLSASAHSFMQMVPQGVTNDYTALNLTTGMGIDPTWEIRAHNTIQGGVSDAFSIWGGTGGSEQTALAIDGTNGNIGIGTVAPTAELTISGRIDQIDIGESTFLGFEAGKVDDLTVNKNVFVGYQAGVGNTAGYDNTATGYKALLTNSTGDDNTATGYQSLYYTTASKNTATGQRALYYNAAGYSNTSTGYQSLYSNTDGFHNVADSYQALYSNTTGDDNTGIGYKALYTNSTGDKNIGLGTYAGQYETGSNAFYVNNMSRSTTAGDKTLSLMYGVMAAAAADQDLTINARLRLSVSYTPATSTTACSIGEVAWDASYIYICTTTNWWERTAIAHW